MGIKNVIDATNEMTEAQRVARTAAYAYRKACQEFMLEAIERVEKDEYFSDQMVYRNDDGCLYLIQFCWEEGTIVSITRVDELKEG